LTLRTYIYLIILFIPIVALSQPGPPPGPDPPTIDFVSVDTGTNHVYIRWYPKPADTIDRFVVYEFRDEAGFVLDTVGPEIREFIWETTKAEDQAVSMTISSERDGYALSPFTAPHTTIHLTTHYDSCEKEIQLDWTPYQGWEDDMVRHDVFVSIDGGAYDSIDATGDTVYSFVHNNIEDNHHYCYVVKAIRSDGAGSFSNIACRMVEHPLHPQWIDAEQASALGEDQISMEFYIEESAEVTSFQVYKSSGPGKPFIEHQVFTDVSGPTLPFTDEVVSTGKPYQYKLYSLDVCGQPVVASNVTGNVVLQATSVALQAFLSWTPYTDYEAGVKNYHIYRITNQADPVEIDAVDAPDTAYTDNLDFVSGSDIEDEICYYVVAEENDGVSRGQKGYSQSNTTCISVTPNILMPNAFTPNDDGRNDIIKPVLTFIPEKYTFQVFDRWGGRMFQTTDPEEGWDGSIMGNGKASEGVYIYYILLTTTKGIEVEQRGEITLFYP
jgi:gliding motility-associated-like protein